MLFQKWSGFFRCFFWQSLIKPCLHLVVNPLYLLLWSLLLIVDFDSVTSTSWRVFFSWLDVVKGFFFTMERILRSSTTVVLCGRPGLFMLLSSPVLSFFSECTKLWFGQSECSCDLSNGFVLFLKSNNCLFHLHVEILWPHDVGSQQQLPHAMTHLESIPVLRA